MSVDDLARTLVDLSLEVRRPVLAQYSTELLDALRKNASVVSIMVDAAGVFEVHGRYRDHAGRPQFWGVVLGAPAQIKPVRTEMVGWGLCSDNETISLIVDCDDTTYELLIRGEEDRELYVAGNATTKFEHAEHLREWARTIEIERFVTYLRDEQRHLVDARH